MAKPRRSITADLLEIGKGIARVFFSFYLPVVAVLVLVHFPYETDPGLHPMVTVNASSNSDANATSLPPRRSAEFYEAVYSGPDKNGMSKRAGVNYEVRALEAAREASVPERVTDFLEMYGLKDKKVLEVGSGQGSLQDLAADYTGLDISAAAASKYHKNFVVASATAMPFPDDTFDAVWTVWVMEHIPEPERALREIRRVLKPGGKLYLHVAWNCPSWLADGFNVRSYSDFNWKGKIVKASLLVRDTGYFKSTYRLPTRMIRWAQYARNGANEPLRFSALEPNYTTYWEPDSDAAVNLDSVEALLWHTAQGDRCLNCGSTFGALANPPDAWMLEIRK